MRLLIATISLLLLPMTANAEGWYAGVAGGSTDLDTGVTAVTGATLDETGSGISWFIGKDIDEIDAIFLSHVALPYLQVYWIKPVRKADNEITDTLAH